MPWATRAWGRSFARDMVLLEQSGVNPVVVHGGGPQIGAMLKKLGISSQFLNGLRITDKPTIEIVEMVLCGSINKQIVGFINAEGGRGDRPLRQGRQHGHRDQAAPVGERRPQRGRPCGSTSASWGEPSRVDTMVLDQTLGRELIPVLAPVAQGEDGETYNVNADTFAGAIAGSLKAKRAAALDRRAGACSTRTRS